MIVARRMEKCVSAVPLGCDAGKGGSHQKESIGKESVYEHGESHISSQSSAMVGDRCGYYGDNNAHELVATVGNQIINLALTLDVQKVLSQPQDDQFESKNNEAICESDAKQLRLELSIQSC